MEASMRDTGGKEQLMEERKGMKKSFCLCMS
jgi:hypothetical protein